jgi:hypothetical protein
MSKIWIRVVSFTVDRGKPELGIVVYPTEVDAKDAAKQRGGLALPVDSADLKNMFTPQEFSIDGVREFHRSAILTKIGDSVARFLENSFEVDYSTLPYERVTETVPYDDGSEREPRTIHYDACGSEAHAWFEQLESELGAFVHFV